MKLKHIMKRSPQTIGPKDKLTRARDLMAWGGFRHLPVVSDGLLVGLITARDITAHQARSGESLASSPGDLVDQAMERDVETAHPEDLTVQAAGRMATQKIGCLPIMEDGQLIGLVTTTDLLAAQVSESIREHAQTAFSVADFMTRDPVVALPDDLLLDAAARMQRQRIRHLPVVDANQRVIGMLSDQDVRTAIGDPSRVFERDLASSPVSSLHVRDAMTRPAITTTTDRSGTDLARDFVRLSATAMPVVDSDDKLLGIVSYIDVLRTYQP